MFGRNAQKVGFAVWHKSLEGHVRLVKEGAEMEVKSYCETWQWQQHTVRLLFSSRDGEACES